MPTVLRVGKFTVQIYLPPREHAPPHVHVFHGDGEVVIELGTSTRAQTIRSVFRMRSADIVAAFRLVETYSEYLLQQWRKYHD